MVMRTLWILRIEIGVGLGAADVPAVGALCRALKPMGGAPADAAIGFVVAHGRPVDHHRLEAVLARAALPATEAQYKKYRRKAS
ncbi:MAG: hypothetical protein AAFZ09_04180 [Pseudomonadota bacterium]